MFASVQGVRAPMFRSTLVAAALCSLLALGACGGGGSDGPTAQPSGSGNAAVYVGTWQSNCLPDSPGGSRMMRSVVTQTAPQKLLVTRQVLVYLNTTCAGVVQQTVDFGQEVFTLVGGKTVDGKAVDKVNISSDGTEYKLLVYTDGRTLLLGEDDAPADPDGYPTVLDTSVVFTRQ